MTDFFFSILYSQNLQFIFASKMATEKLREKNQILGTEYFLLKKIIFHLLTVVLREFPKESEQSYILGSDTIMGDRLHFEKYTRIYIKLLWLRSWYSQLQKHLLGAGEQDAWISFPHTSGSGVVSPHPLVHLFLVASWSVNLQIVQETTFNSQRIFSSVEPQMPLWLSCKLLASRIIRQETKLTQKHL